MVRKLLSCLFLLFLTGKAPDLTAQPGITFSHLTIDENLSQSSVYAIESDKYGFMWFGTRDGLNRFDSRRNVIYRKAGDKPNSLSSNAVNVLAKDRKGRLWVGTSGGLNLYRPDTDDFLRIRQDSLDRTSLCNNNVSAILHTTDGALWIGTRRGLSRLTSLQPKARFEHYMLGGNTAGDTGAFDIKTLFEDSKGTLWAGTTTGISKITRHRGNKYEISHYYLRPEDSLWHNTSNWVNAIAEAPDGNLWLGTETRGIAVFDPASGRVTAWNPLRNLDMSSYAVRVIKPDENGFFWIGTMSGLLVSSADGNSWRRYVNAPDVPGSLNDNSIRAIYKSADGTVWVGTFYGGVSYYNPLSQQFGALRLQNGKSRRPFKIAGPMVAARAGGLWLGTDDKGLFLVDREHRILKHFRHDPADPNSLSNDKIKCLLPDGADGLWVGTIKGLNYLDVKSGRITRFLNVSEDPGSLPDDRIYGLAYDREGKLWIATFRGGLCVFEPKARKFSQFAYQNRTERGPPSNSVTCLLIDREDRIWLGTTTGLAQKIKGQQRFVHYFASAGNPNSLGGNYVVGLYEDHKGRLWISTRGAGLTLFEPGRNRFTRFPEVSNLSGNNVYTVLEDNRGKCWVATDNGLCKLDPETGKSEVYDRNDGLICKEFLPNSAYKDAGGNLYFGGFNGIVTFNPDSILQNSRLPAMVFTGLRIFNKPVAVGNNSMLRQSLQATKAITFDYKQNVFSVEFAAISFVDARKNQFAYQLAGFEKERNVVAEPVATYMNLEPGDYTLKVWGSNNNGVWNPHPLEMKITVLPPPWKTAWAYAGYVAVFLGLLYTWSRYHTERLRLAHDLRLENLEKQQQQELHQTRINFFTNIIHEIRTPLTLIMGPMAMVEEKAAAGSELRKQLDVMKGSVGRLMRLVEQLLDFQKHETGNARLQLQRVGLETWLRMVAGNFTAYAAARGIELTLDTPTVTEVRLDPGEMEKVLYNLLSNACKFTPTGGRIRIATAPGNHKCIRILVEDNGIGISEQELERIFHRFYQVNNASGSGFGIGLALSRNIVELHQGTITVESRESVREKHGFTRFLIDLPVVSDPADEIPETLQEELLPEDNGHSETAAEETGPASGNRPGRSRPKLLLVEDQQEVRVYLKGLLQHTYEIYEAANGTAGWELASTVLPDLVISDVAMPLMDGVTLTAQIKSDERTNHIPVILLTARDSVQHQVTGLAHGADDYVIKPFHPRVLLARVQNLLRLREELREKYKYKVRLEPVVEDQEHPDTLFLSKLMRAIEANIANPDFSLADLVQEMGMSRPVLFRKVKMLTDSPVMDLVRSVRMKKAEALLKQKTMTISEVAFAVGFNDPKYFSKYFRSQFGKAPSEYTGR